MRPSGRRSTPSCVRSASARPGSPVRPQRETYLDALAERGPDDAELNRDYAAPLAAHNLVDLLGLPEPPHRTCSGGRTLSSPASATCSTMPDIWARCEPPRREVDALLDELVPFYATPRRLDDLGMGDSGLPDAAVGANVKLTISGGMNEPQHMITNIVWALSRHPEQRDRVLADAGAVARGLRRDRALAVPDRHVPPRDHHAPRSWRASTACPGDAGRGRRRRQPRPRGFDAPQTFDISRPSGRTSASAAASICARATGRPASPSARSPCPCSTTASRPAHRSTRETWDGWVFRGLTSLPVTWGAPQLSKPTP